MELNKLFEMPEAQVVLFSNEDVITTSGENWLEENETPEVEL